MRVGHCISALLTALLIGSGTAYCAEPEVAFDHKNLGIHMKMDFRRFKSFERRMPRSMRREIGEDYYPYLRQHLTTADTLSYKAARIAVDRHDDETVTLSFEFPNYYLSFCDVTWEMMDDLFQKYFKK